MRGRPWAGRIMVLGGLLAVAAGTWFTLTRGEVRVVEPGDAGPPSTILPRMDRRRPGDRGRGPLDRPAPPPLPPADPRVRYREAPSVHIPGLRDPTPAVRSFSAWQLKVGDPTLEALLPLAECLEDGDPGVRMAAAAALGEYADLPAGIVQRLATLVGTDPSLGVCLRALWAASGRGNAALLDPAIGLYRTRGGNNPTGERTPPMDVLEGIARAGPGGHEFLKVLLLDPDPSVRRAALQELPTSWMAWPEVRKDPKGIPLLAGMLDDPVPSVRSSAAWALGRWEGPALPVQDRLARLLEDETDYGAVEYAWALFHITGRVDVAGPLLERKLASTDAKARLAGCLALGRLGAAGAPWKAALRERFEDDDPKVRDAARFALVNIGGK